MITCNLNPFIISNLNDTISLDNVEANILDGSVAIQIPKLVNDEIERNKKCVDYINECRNSMNPFRKSIFPIGSATILNVRQLFNDIQDITNNFMHLQLTQENIESMNAQLDEVYSQFLNYNKKYITHI